MLKKYYNINKLEVGIDEAGRGPLFGRLYVGAVILPSEDLDTTNIKDSKKLSARKRLMVYDYIKENAIDYNVEYATAETIDNSNILVSVHQTMHMAVHKLLVRPEFILVDGNSFPLYQDKIGSINHVCIEGGDNIYTAIAAASILAKVEHDKYIEKICDKYEELEIKYDLRNNKGYGTAKHISGIKTYGISPWHRKTFGICKSYS